MMNVTSGSLKPGRRRDPLRRLFSTPLVADLPLMGRTVRLETNNPAIIERTQALLNRYPKPPIAVLNSSGGSSVNPRH